MIDFAKQIKIVQVKAWLATFKARNANPKLFDDRRKKQTNKQQLDRPAEGVHVRLRRSIVDLVCLGRCRSLSKSVVFGFFKFLVFYGCFYLALPIYSQSFAKSFYFSVEPSKEGSTENRNLLSARAAHNVQTLRALLSAMEALPQAPWSGKAARFMAKSSTVRVSGFEARLAVFICAHRVVLGSFVFVFVFLFCLFSTLVRTAGCLSRSPSLVLAEALHVRFFFFYFSSLAIHSASFVSSGFLVMMWQVEVVVV